MLTPLPCRCSCPPRPPPLATCRLFEALAIDCGKLKVLAEAITAGYRQLPYHNAVHACDVAHGTFWLLKQQAPRPPPDDGNKPGDKTKGGAPPPPPFREGATCDELMPPYALLAAVLAAPLHDINHDGHNNTYHQQSSSEWAMTYASAPLPFRWLCPSLQVMMPLPSPTGTTTSRSSRTCTARTACGCCARRSSSMVKVAVLVRPQLAATGSSGCS